MNNAHTEEAIAIRLKLAAHGFKMIGLPEMKKSEQVYVLQYLQTNEFNKDELIGIAKLFKCHLFEI